MSKSNLRISEVTAKSILNPSRIGGVAYAINPYIGCQHACSYCYARFMQRYTGHMGEEWGTFVDIKINAARILQQQLRRRRKPTRDPILFSSVTDAYQPVERRFQITRQCLELLQHYQFSVSILTKSDLVLRDVDLLGSLVETEVGMTIITLDEHVQRVFEAGAPPVERRLEALKIIASQGIRTFAFIGPIIPYLSTPTLEELIRRLGDCGVSNVFFDRLNLKYGNRPVIEQAIRINFMQQSKDILNALRPRSLYYFDLRDQLIELAQRYGLEAEILF